MFGDDAGAGRQPARPLADAAGARHADARHARRGRRHRAAAADRLPGGGLDRHPAAGLRPRQRDAHRRRPVLPAAHHASPRPRSSCWPTRSGGRAANSPTASNPAPRCPARACSAGCSSSPPSAIAGLPPLSGFLGKFMLLQAALESPLLPWVWSVVLVTGLVGRDRAGAERQPAVLPHPRPTHRRRTAPRAADWRPSPACCCSGSAWWSGPAPLSDYATATAAQLLEPQAYIDAVLGARP